MVYVISNAIYTSYLRIITSMKCIHMYFREWETSHIIGNYISAFSTLTKLDTQEHCIIIHITWLNCSELCICCSHERKLSYFIHICDLYTTAVASGESKWIADKQKMRLFLFCSVFGSMFAYISSFTDTALINSFLYMLRCGQDPRRKNIADCIK